jgi:hypothetical protein
MGSVGKEEDLEVGDTAGLETGLETCAKQGSAGWRLGLRLGLRLRLGDKFADYFKSSHLLTMSAAMRAISCSEISFEPPYCFAISRRRWTRVR